MTDDKPKQGSSKEAENKAKEFQKTINNEIDKESENLKSNGLGSAFLGFNPSVSGVHGRQINQADSFFASNRWYLISNMRQLLSQIYVEHGLISTLVDLPVDDALRDGINITSEELSGEDIDVLHKKMEREEDLIVVSEALKWARLFGGGGIIINVNEQADKEFKVSNIKQGDEKIRFIPVDLWELYSESFNAEDYEMEDLGPKSFDEKKNHFNYYGQRLHNSRVLKMKGKRAPSFIRKRLRGWGVSVVESVMRSINQFLKATDLNYEVLDEFKIDVLKINNLSQALATAKGEEAIRRRVELAQMIKNFQSMLVMDGEDDYSQKQISFTGIAETMDSIRKQIASDLRMPMTKLFGISSAGFNSGEDDIENYNAMVESQVRSKCRFEILKIIEIRCMQLFGFIPKDISFSFESLRVMSSTDEEGVKTQKHNRVLQARQAGEISPRDYKESVNAAELFPIKIDVSDETWATAVSDTFQDRINDEAEIDDNQDETLTLKQEGMDNV